MKGYHDNIELATEANEKFRKVLYTGHNLQLVLMTLQPGEEPLKMYTIYGPPEHIDGKIHETPADAHADHEHFDGRTTE